MDKQSAHMAGVYVKSFLPGLFMQGMLDIDRNFLSSLIYSFGKSDISLKS